MFLGQEDKGGRDGEEGGRQEEEDRRPHPDFAPTPPSKRIPKRTPKRIPKRTPKKTQIFHKRYPQVCAILCTIFYVATQSVQFCYIIYRAQFIVHFYVHFYVRLYLRFYVRLTINIVRFYVHFFVRCFVQGVSRWRSGAGV